MAASNTNISVQQPLGENQNQIHQKPLIRRSSGRRKAPEGNEVAKKNKPAQRGMGVEKLEKLRIHEESLIKLNPNNPMANLINHNYQQFSNVAGFGAPNVGFGQMGLMNHNNLGMDLFGSSSVIGAGSSSTVVSGISRRELSFTPSGNKNEYCRNPNCNKKKRFNGENFRGDNQKLQLVHQVGYSVCPGVEVLAVHKKGSKLMSKNQEEGSTHVVMEYEFFPSGRKDSNNDELFMMEDSYNNPKTGSGASASASCVTLDGSSSNISCIDLSLKL